MFDRVITNIFDNSTTIDPHAENHYSWSPYAYCSDNPLNKTDPDGKDDYFTPTGKYLGTDGDPDNNNIRIMTSDNFKTLTSGLDKNEYSAVANMLQSSDASTLFSGANMKDNSMLNVYQHYNSTGLPLEVNNDLGKNTAMQSNLTTAEGKSVVQVNVEGNKNDSRHLYDNVNNVKNTFAHEKKHIDDFKKDPVGESKKSNAEKERNAIESQKKDPTYKNTTDDYKDAVNQYGKQNGM